MKSFRRKRRPGNRAMTPDEAARVVAAKEGPCVACYLRAREWGMDPGRIAVGGDYNHCKSGNIRRGHAAGYCLCDWHHRHHPVQGVSHASMRDVWGPSLMDGSRLFHETYGSDDELIALQTEIIEGRKAA